MFWLAFYALGTLVLLVSWRSFGKTSFVAVLLQLAVAVWACALVLHVRRARAAYVPAAIWVLLLGVPLAYQVGRRAHHWITIGMESADGTGSPMAFLFHFVLEWTVFAPLCCMLAVLVFVRPWRVGGRAITAT